MLEKTWISFTPLLNGTNTLAHTRFIKVPCWLSLAQYESGELEKLTEMKHTHTHTPF